MLNRASRKLEIQPDLARKVVGGPAGQDDDPRRLLRLRGRRQHGLHRHVWRTRSCARASTQLLDEADARPVAGDEPDTDPSRAARPAGPARRRARPEQRRDDGPAAGADRDRPRALADRADSATPTCSPATRRARARASSRSTRPTARRTSRTATRPSADLPKAWRKDAKIEVDEDDPVTVNVKLVVPVVLPGLGSPFKVSDHAATSVEDDAAARPSQTKSTPGSEVDDRGGCRDESGQASAELMGMIWWLVLVAVIVWQICSSRGPTTQVSNAARTASRVEGRGGDAEKAAQERALRRRCARRSQKIDVDGETADVQVRIPIAHPGAARTTTSCRDRPQRDAARADGPARPHRGEPSPALQRGRRRRRRRLLPPAAARGGRPLRDRRAVVRAAAPRAPGARRRPHGLARGPGALDRRAHAADPARDRRGDRPRRARAAARRPVGDGDHGQRARRDLRRAQRPDRARRHHLHRRGPALPDDRPHRLAGEPARRRVEPDGRRPPAHRRARQRDHPAARAARPDDDDPPLPAAVHARPAGRDGLARPADRRSCCARSCEAQAQHRHLRRHRRGQDDAAERDVGRGARPASGSSPSRTTPSCGCSSRTWSRSRRARPTSRARARSRSATSCATRCACAPTASSSARSAAPRRSTCCRRSTPATRARWSPCTPTRSTTRSTASRRWRR